MFDCTFVECRQCFMWPLINENKQQLDKEEKCKIMYYLIFFEKNLIPKTWKPLITKWKSWIGSFILPKETLETCTYPEYVLRLQKERQMWQKTKFPLLFFVKNPCVASKVITNSLKTLDFVTPIPFETFPWNVLCNLSIMKLGNNYTKNIKARLCETCYYRKKKLFPKTWKPLKTKRKIWKGSFFFQKKLSRPAIIQNMSYVHKKNVKHDKN